MKRNYKLSAFRLAHRAGTICACALLIGSISGCTKGLEDGLANLQTQVNGLEQKVQALELKLSDQISTLDKFITENITVKSVTFDEATGKYAILLSDGTTIEVNKATDPVPMIGIEQDENGAYYWTLDGKPILLPNGDKLFSAPSLRVNSISGCWEVSADGGATYISTGIKAGKDASIITKVDEDDTYVYFTLADGSSIKVAKTVDYGVSMLAGRQYFNNGQTREVKVSMSGVKKSAIYSKPDGWRASLKGDVLRITAPSADNKSAEKEGAVIVQVWYNDGTSDITEISVKVGVAPHEITVNPDLSVEITLDPALEENWEWSGSVVGVRPLSDFSEAKLIDELKNNTRLPIMFPDQFPYTSTVKDMLGTELVKGESYVVYAVDSYNDFETYELLYTVIVAPDVKISVRDITFEDATISVQVKGINEYYAGARPKADWDPQLLLDDVAAGYALSLQSSYEGPLSKYCPDSFYPLNIKPGMDLIAYVLPKVEGKEYTIEDIQTIDVKIASITLGGQATVTMSPVTADMTSVSTTITKDAGTYKYWVDYFTDDQMKNLVSDQLIFEELSKRNLRNRDTYTYTRTGLVADSKGWIVALAIDKNGKAGKVNKIEANTSSVVYSTTTLSEPTVSVSFSSATLKFPALAGIKSYRYLDDLRNSWENDKLYQGDLAITEKYLAMQKRVTYPFESRDAEADGSLTLELTGKTTNQTYVCIIEGVDEKGLCTHAIKVEYTPYLSKYIDNTKPNYKAISIKSIEIDSVPISERNSDYYYDVERGWMNMKVTLDAPAECQKIWVACIAPQDLNDPKGTKGKIATAQILSDHYTITCTPDNPVVVNDFFSNLTDIYVVWQDKDGNYYQYVSVDPDPMLCDIIQPENYVENTTATPTVGFKNVLINDKPAEQWTVEEYKAMEQKYKTTYVVLDMDIVLPENCQKLWLYEANTYQFPYYEGTNGIIPTQVISGSTRAQVFTPGNTAYINAKLEMYKHIYVAWQDTAGKIHQYEEFNPQTLFSNYAGEAKY